MIYAAINPITDEFLGLVIPKEDLLGKNTTVAIYGSAADWESLAKGGHPNLLDLGVTHTTTTGTGNLTMSLGKFDPLESMGIHSMDDRQEPS